VGVFFSLLFQIGIIAAIVLWLVNRNKNKSRLRSRTQAPGNITVTEEIRMKETMLDQMNNELEKTGQTDTTVNIVGIILNLLFLGINTGVGAASHQPQAGLAIKLVFVVLTAFLLILNLSVWLALMAGKKRRVKIIDRLEKFWADEGLGKYQDDSLGTGYSIRGNLFTVITTALGGVAFFVSLIAFFVGF
jgi:hypothetical protein